jgi:hypothetical protein
LEGWREGVNFADGMGELILPGEEGKRRGRPLQPLYGTGMTSAELAAWSGAPNGRCVTELVRKGKKKLGQQPWGEEVIELLAFAWAHRTTREAQMAHNTARKASWMATCAVWAERERHRAAGRAFRTRYGCLTARGERGVE